MLDQILYCLLHRLARPQDQFGSHSEIPIQGVPDFILYQTTLKYLQGMCVPRFKLARCDGGRFVVGTEISRTKLQS